MEKKLFQPNHLNDDWPPELEEAFCHILLQYAGTSTIADDFEAECLMSDIAREVGDVLVHRVTLEEVRVNYYRLKERYETFSFMLKSEEIKHCEVTKNMFVPAWLQVQLLEQMPFFENYFLLGETRWPSLKGIFGGLEDINNHIKGKQPNVNSKGGRSNNPIILSDSDPQTEPISKMLETDYVVHHYFRCRRKLFDNHKEEIGDNGCAKVVLEPGDENSVVGHFGMWADRSRRRKATSNNSNTDSESSTAHSRQRLRINLSS